MPSGQSEFESPFAHQFMCDCDKIAEEVMLRYKVLQTGGFERIDMYYDGAVEAATEIYERIIWEPLEDSTSATV